MRIDPKYFNTFLVIIGVVAAILIAFFTINSRQSEKAAFKKRMMGQDSLKTVWWRSVQAADSVRIADFKGQFVVVDFWADWSDASLNSHRELAEINEQFSDRLQVLAASVGHPPKTIQSYIRKHQFPFLFVNGSQHFTGFDVPGIPAQLVYDPEGNLQSVFLGYSDDSQYDSLKVLMNGRKK